MKIVELTGKRFGRLVAIRCIGSRQEGKRRFKWWLCQCDCGNFTEVRTGHLTAGTTQGCGCRRKLPTGEAVFNQLFDNYKRNAKKFDRSFTLTKKQFRELTKEDCHYCGNQPSAVKENIRMNGVYVYNGVDRINNAEGYTKENCAACCKLCNFMKRDLTTKEFLQHVKKIYMSSVI